MCEKPYDYLVNSFVANLPFEYRKDFRILISFIDKEHKKLVDYEEGKLKGKWEVRQMLVKLARIEKTKRDVFRSIIKWLNEELKENGVEIK